MLLQTLQVSHFEGTQQHPEQFINASQLGFQRFKMRTHDSFESFRIRMLTCKVFPPDGIRRMKHLVDFICTIQHVQQGLSGDVGISVLDCNTQKWNALSEIQLDLTPQQVPQVHVLWVL